MNPENLYFVDTPKEIQDSEYFNILNELEKYNISEKKIIYVKWTPISNYIGKYYFQIFLSDDLKNHEMLKDKPEYIIFFPTN